MQRGGSHSAQRKWRRFAFAMCSGVTAILVLGTAYTLRFVARMVVSLSLPIGTVACGKSELEIKSGPLRADLSLAGPDRQRRFVRS